MGVFDQLPGEDEATNWLHTGRHLDNDEVEVTEQIVMWSQILLICTSSCLTIFYCYMRWLGKCRGEVIYVAVATAIIYTVAVAAGPKLTWVATSNGLIPLGRYFTWLLTCPVIIMQMMKLHAAVGYRLAKEQENFMVVLDQLMIVCGAYGAVSAGVQKWIFFVLSVCAGFMLFLNIYMVFRQNHKNFPEDVKYPVVLMACLYFTSWILYPLLWLLGNPGLGFISIEIDSICHAFGDLIAKNVFGFVAWYIRWQYLEDAFTTNTGKILVTREKGKGRTGLEKYGLSPDELENAETAPYNILLLDKSILVHKTIVMMMEEVGVEVSIAFDFQHAKDHLTEQPSYLYDAVLVVPDHHQTKDEIENLKEFAKFITSGPYKIPMLALYFDGKAECKLPGEWIHGILSRPLDERQVMRELYQWRITACVWRRVALTMAAIEGAEQGPNLDDHVGEKDMSTGAISDESLRLRRRGSMFGQQLFQVQGKEYNTTAVVPNVGQYNDPKIKPHNFSTNTTDSESAANEELNQNTVGSVASSIGSNATNSLRSIGELAGAFIRPFVTLDGTDQPRNNLPSEWSQSGSPKAKSDADLYSGYG